MSIVSNEVA